MCQRVVGKVISLYRVLRVMRLFLIQNPSKLDQFKYEHQIFHYGSISFSFFFGGVGLQRLKEIMLLCSQIDISYNNFSSKSAPPTCPDNL
jgi:hypothetical protein